MVGKPEPSLEELGLAPGETVRWQRRSGGHWQTGAVIRREADGSVAVHDADGAWRSIAIDKLEARRRTSRGSLTWQTLSDRTDQSGQLPLWS